jgi:hypothetical protein
MRLRPAVLLALLPASAAAQTLVELRGATTEYRFVDVNHTFRSGLWLDLLYLGAPGSNELYAGGGWAYRPARGVTLMPILYAIAAKENRERGFSLSASVVVDRGGWRVLGFGGHFFRLSGDTPDYDFLDSLDVTRVVAGRWEVGVSAGFLHIGKDWNGLIGGTVKLNDARGTTALAVRGGYRGELRLIRTFTF